jgi:hypothetical protein
LGCKFLANCDRAKYKLPISVLFRGDLSLRAFTHLCSKVNISLFGDTITIYPKKNGKKSTNILKLERNPGEWLSIIGTVKCEFPEIKLVLKYHGSQLKSLGHIRNVRHEDPSHFLYHLDDLSLDDTHYHLKFKKINRSILEGILTIFVECQVISPEEKESILKAFTKANVIEESFKAHIAFLSQLETMREKAKELAKEAKKDPINYNEPATKAWTLCESLSSMYNTYEHSRTSIAYEHFKEQANIAINDEDTRKELENHRGWKEIFANIGIAVALLGIGYLIAGLYNLSKNGRFMLFKPKTKSGEELDCLANAFGKLLPLPPA